MAKANQRICFFMVVSPSDNEFNPRPDTYPQIVIAAPQLFPRPRPFEPNEALDKPPDEDYP